jgi:ribosome-binding protein aMBF1 (putative translation factor)
MATSHDAEGDHLRARTSAAERLWFNKELKLTKPCTIGASQLNSSVRQTLRRRMRKRRVTATTILTDSEVQQALRAIRPVFGEGFEDLAASRGINLEDSVRFLSVARRCHERRAAQGWSLKDVARRLNVPQYRLKDIEAGRLTSVTPEILQAYVSHLSLDSWLRRWRRSNPDVALRLPFGTNEGAGASGSKALSNGYSG